MTEGVSGNAVGGSMDERAVSAEVEVVKVTCATPRDFPLVGSA